MERALYDSAGGYYTRSRNPVSKSGDYLTSNAISPVFAFALARLVDDFVKHSGDELCAIVDIGCGDGQLIQRIAEQTDRRYRDHCVFFGIDRSLERIDEAMREDGFAQYRETLDGVPFDIPVLILSNELFDAFPVARLVQRGKELHELWVTPVGEGLDWTELPAPDAYAGYFADRRIALDDGQFADVSLDWSGHYSLLAEKLERGLIVTFDYGCAQEQLFNPRFRRYGTAAAYSQHRFNRDLLANPGGQDLTAQINFTDLWTAGERNGMSTLAFERQARFLLSLGILEHPVFKPSEASGGGTLESTIAGTEERQAAQRLVLPDGIGDELRVLVQSKGYPRAGWRFLERPF